MTDTARPLKMTDTARPLKTGLILGSASPRRVALMKQIGAAFETRVAGADETLDSVTEPGDYVLTLSARKANAVSASVNGDAAIRKKYGRVIIIGADTVVAAANGEILGKPKDAADARRMLGLLSGKWHEVCTGVALIDMKVSGDNGSDGFLTCGTLAEYEKTRVKVCMLDESEIDCYAASGEPDGKAGAYAVQGAGSLFIERVEGCYYNVVGLPLRLLRTMLSTLGYDLLKTNCLG